MMDAAEAALLARGVPRAKIKIERFSTDPLSAERLVRAEQLSQKAAGIPMQVTLDGRRARVAFDAEKGSILESVRAAGLRAPFACKQGVCATCKARLISGTVEMKANYALTEDDLAKGYILTCQSVPTSDDVVLDYDLCATTGEARRGTMRAREHGGGDGRTHRRDPPMPPPPSLRRCSARAIPLPRSNCAQRWTEQHLTPAS